MASVPVAAVSISMNAMGVVVWEWTNSRRREGDDAAALDGRPMASILAGASISMNAMRAIHQKVCCLLQNVVGDDVVGNWTGTRRRRKGFAPADSSGYCDGARRNGNKR